MSRHLLRMRTSAGSPTTLPLDIDSDAAARAHWQREVAAYRELASKGLFVGAFEIELLTDGRPIATTTIHPSTT